VWLIHVVNAEQSGFAVHQDSGLAREIDCPTSATVKVCNYHVSLAKVESGRGPIEMHNYV